MDAGGFTGYQEATAEARSLFLLRTMKDMGYSAVTVGVQDLRLGDDLLRALAAEKEFPLVSANVRDGSTNELLFPDAVVVRKAGARIGITAVSRPSGKLQALVDGSAMEFLDPAESLVPVLKRLEREADVVVLLAQVPEREARAIGERFGGQIDIVVLAQAQARGEPSLPEHGGAVYVTTMDKGQALGVTRVALEDAEVTAIVADELVLTKYHPEDPELAEVVDAFRRNLNELMKEQAVTDVRQRRHTRDGQFFTGAESCGSCHQEEYDLWMETPHAHAFETLVDAGTEALPECFGCHVTGHGDPAGYVPRFTDASRFLNVQCEVCHDKGSLHSRDGSYGKALLMNACAGCHDGNNSPLFDPEVYWLMIEH